MGFGGPVEDADAVGSLFDGVDEVGEELELSLGGAGPEHVFAGGDAIAAGLGVAGFCDEEGFVVIAIAVGHVLLEFGEGAVVVGIEGLSDDVVIDVGLGEVVEVPFGDGPIAAAVDVDDDFDGVVGGGFADAFGTGFDEADEVGPLGGVVIGIGEGLDAAGIGFDVGVGDLNVAEGPEHSAGGFVADLDHVGHDAGGFELGEDIFGVGFDLFFEGGGVEGAPGDGGFLMLGVGPGVGVVDVEEEGGAGGFDLLGEGDGVFEGVVGGGADG